MNYSPRGLYVWDAWYVARGEEVHAWHLQRVRPGASFPPGYDDALGHAVSRDLITWEECPPGLAPDPANPDDNLQMWTGSTVWHEGRGYLFYTMRGSRTAAREQRLGLALSDDLRTWRRHLGNPILTPDPRWYATAAAPVPGVVDCRDPLVVAAPQGGWYLYFATRRPGEELPETSVIGLAWSPDLVHWEQRPPAFAPGTYACLEAHDVFELHGRWYLTALVGAYYGNRGVFRDPHLAHGTIYAVAEQPEGPFVELADNALVGAATSAPITCRSVVLGGERHLLYTDRERVGHADAGELTFGTITTPKRLDTSGDRLVARYSPRVEAAAGRELIGPGHPPVWRSGEYWGQIWPMPSARWQWGERVIGSSRTGWEVASLGVRSDSYVYESTITIERGQAAGLAIRMAGPKCGAVVLLDSVDQVVAYAEAPRFDFSERRTTPIPCGVPLHLRIVSRLEHLEVYLHDELRLAFGRYRGLGGEVGLFVDRATAHFSDLRLRELVVTRPA